MTSKASTQLPTLPIRRMHIAHFTGPSTAESSTKHGRVRHLPTSHNRRLNCISQRATLPKQDRMHPQGPFEYKEKITQASKAAAA
jgi:hypothetical protein